MLPKKRTGGLNGDHIAKLSTKFIQISFASKVLSKKILPNGDSKWKINKRKGPAYNGLWVYTGAV